MIVVLFLSLVRPALAQVDEGFFKVQQKVSGTWTDVGWVSAHTYDPPGTPPPEKHEHWYFGPSFSADLLERRLLYYGGAFAEDKRPVEDMTGWIYALYRVNAAPSLTYVTAPSNTTDPTCSAAKRNFCPNLVYGIKQSSGGSVVAYVNVFDTGSPAAVHENYMLASGWKRSSATNCSVEWIVDPHDNNTGLGSDDAKAVSGTESWAKDWAHHDPSAGVPGTYQAPPASPPACN